MDWAQIVWKQDQPCSQVFDDVYFSSDNGLQETDYVFLQGNDLQNRWQHLDSDHFTIAETGFGTGLNFLAATQLWLKTAPPQAVLHYISTEKYPLNLTDMAKALQLWDELAEISAPLLTNYTELLLGNKKPIFLFNNRIQLTVLIGDSIDSYRKTTAQIYPQMPNSSHQTTLPIDAWFLDGFAPSKNPEMWQPALFENMARLSNTKTTFATFTSAGEVRRSLMQAGFAVHKRAGFGKKREMSYGKFVELVNA